MGGFWHPEELRFRLHSVHPVVGHQVLKSFKSLFVHLLIKLYIYFKISVLLLCRLLPSCTLIVVVCVQFFPLF